MSGNSNGFGSSVTRYLRIGEPFERPAAPTVMALREMGETGGLVARYLKIERYERPSAAPARPKAEKRPAAKPAAPAKVEESHRPARHKPKPVPVVRERKTTAMVQCPDCDAMVSPTWGQCPNCALLLDIAA
jgi:hypothetical protein